MHNAIVRASNELKSQILCICNLPTQTRADDEQAFTFSSMQEREFNRAVDIFLEKMAGRDRTRLGFTNNADESGIIEHYDRYAHSLGITRAYELTGAGDSALSATENESGVQAFMGMAFDRLSENGAMRLEGIRDELRGILEDGVANSINPIDVARSISAQFDEYSRYEFERLARTEIAFAQNAGFIDECQAEQIDTSTVDTSAFPAHPNCLCGYSIEQADNGTWHMVYDVSAQACEVCQEVAQQ